MDALYDESGQVYSWLETETGRILSLHGEHLAFIDGDSVYDWNGRHIAWWQDGHIRDHLGAAAVFTARAGNLGVLKPLQALQPLQPLKALVPLAPLKELKPLRSLNELSWSREIPF